MITVIAGIVMLGASAMLMTPGLWTELEIWAAIGAFAAAWLAAWRVSES